MFYICNLANILTVTSSGVKIKYKHGAGAIDKKCAFDVGDLGLIPTDIHQCP